MRILLSLMLLFGLFFIAPAYAQKKENGKTYHETTDKLKEVFHYREVYKVAQNPNNPDEFKDTMIVVKHGVYACYDEQGKLLKTGSYADNRKDGLWEYYGENGEVIRTEVYENGRLVKKPAK